MAELKYLTSPKITGQAVLVVNRTAGNDTIRSGSVQDDLDGQDVQNTQVVLDARYTHEGQDSQNTQNTLDGIIKPDLCNSNCGRLLGLVPLKRGPSGRMYEARFVFENQSFEVTGELAIRQLFVPALRSSAFVKEIVGDTWHLDGAGWGHGVGMCQSGRWPRPFRAGILSPFWGITIPVRRY